jgi:hypothetical protein
MTPFKFSSERRVGRLVEWRMCPVEQASELRSLERERAKVVEQIGSEVVICVDWREGDVLKPDVADALSTAWHKRAVGFKRSAILLPRDRPTFNLQIERVIRTADVPDRRSFREIAALLQWLKDVLNETELRRAAEFFDTPRSTPP